jgi:hypothetical protein
VSLFGELESLLLVCTDGSSVGYKDVDHAREVAEHFMSSCPFLRRITLRVGQALHASFIKKQDEDMRVEFFPAVDESWHWYT